MLWRGCDWLSPPEFAWYFLQCGVFEACLCFWQTERWFLMGAGLETIHTQLQSGLAASVSCSRVFMEHLLSHYFLNLFEHGAALCWFKTLIYPVFSKVKISFSHLRKRKRSSLLLLHFRHKIMTKSQKRGFTHTNECFLLFISNYRRRTHSRTMFMWLPQNFTVVFILMLCSWFKYFNLN